MGDLEEERKQRGYTRGIQMNNESMSAPVNKYTCKHPLQQKGSLNIALL